MSTFLDSVATFAQDAWDYALRTGEMVIEAVIGGLCVVALLAVLLTIGPSLILLLAGAPFWAALLVLFCN